jgi:hypothetical protein
VCYRGSGYDEAGDPTRSAAGDDAQFLLRQFQKQAAVPVRLRVWYGWSAAGEWGCPDNPRVRYAREPILYKLYVIREVSGNAEAVDGDPGLEFLRTLVPQLRPALFAAEAPTL